MSRFISSRIRPTAPRPDAQTCGVRTCMSPVLGATRQGCVEHRVVPALAHHRLARDGMHRDAALRRASHDGWMPPCAPAP
jgi:hypothetical protein